MRAFTLSLIAVSSLLAAVPTQAMSAPTSPVPPSSIVLVAPVWQSADGTPTAAAMAVAARIARAAEDGLNPAHYPLPAAGEVAYDARMTAALTAFVADLSGGRVRALAGRPDILRAGLAPDPHLAATQIATASDPLAALQQIEPNGADYRAVKAALAQLLVAPAVQVTIPLGATLDPNMEDQRVPLIRQRLGVAGDGLLYDAALQEAVKAFQATEGLDADGRIGRNTQTALNEGNTARARRLRVALDMLRDRPIPQSGPRIEVNIPEFQLRVLNGNSTTMEMPVIVGRRDRQTPPLRTQLTATQFNPPWGVPERNAREDLLPKLRRDPEAVIAQGYRVYQTIDGERQEIDPRTVDWSTVSPRSMPYYFRQDAGDMNSLGQIKFIIPNRDDIFMHDTPNRGLFGRDQRAFSSGCVRLGRPLDLLEFAIGWNQTRIRTALSARNTFAVPVARPIPVLIEYRTAIVGGSDTVSLRPDIYGLDERYARALEAAPAHMAVR